MLLSQLAEVEKVLVKLCLRRIIIGQNRRESTGNESESRYACEHNADTIDTFEGCGRRQVSIAHGGCSRYDPIKRHDVELVNIHHVVVRVPHPRAHVIVECSEENEHAGSDVEEEYEEDAEEEQALLALIDAHVRGELRYLLLALQQLQHLCQPDHANELV